MARPNQQQQIVGLLAKYEPVIRDAFIAAIRDITDSAQISRIIENLEHGNIEGAVQALHIDPAAYQGLDTAIRQSYLDSGATTIATLPVLRDPSGARLVIRFDARNVGAEAWLAEYSSTQITGIVDDQLTAVRQVLSEGLANGVNPRTTALNVIGRLGATGRREGGILGLTSPQEQFVASAREELQSGDPGLMRNYLGRGRRDARFDAVVKKAIEAKKPLDKVTVNRLAGRYADRLLQLRGETIGRTESMASIHAASMEAYRQAVASGAVARNAVRKGWKATKDDRTRDSHRHLDGEFVGLEERFANGLLYPGDPDGPIEERANCRCRPIFRIDRLSNLE